MTLAASAAPRSLGLAIGIAVAGRVQATTVQTTIKHLFISILAPGSIKPRGIQPGGGTLVPGGPEQITQPEQNAASSSHQTRKEQLLRIVGPVDFLHRFDHDLECRIAHPDNSRPEFLLFRRAERFAAADIGGDGIDRFLPESALVEVHDFTEHSGGQVKRHIASIRMTQKMLSSSIDVRK